MSAVAPLSDDEWPSAVDLVRRAGLPVDDLVAGRQRLWAARLGGRLVGVIGAEVYGATVLVRSLAVEAPFRGQGWASALFASLEAWWGRRGPLVLLTETAEAFFARRGFVVVPRDQVPAPVQTSAEFRNLCPVSARAMVRNAVDAPRVSEGSGP